ncbi:putative S-adenosyl-L-methionine (SAM)-dependent methyltransferase [Bradyrhizobium oligotrophicum S58]|uniref:Putative S-adenosyl-L-methionine (SAM)-dependent methyltransferase n=1 Tax=Bradyrhizobium oligotrophicum S58 TaxID=1245469 RepID=M4Z6Z2_9BRAD|nr:methyltransferase domain-containing protein [Bradyrhizobium oligotrophicum]BAM89333.1 putative S-adenosyl-L-methionine (SAM)-dependent methyltransferase [Bradyrhizobium oligotrophicum S58]
MDAAVADTSFGHFENAEQIAFWNGAGGARWVARRAELDAMLAPVRDALLEHAALEVGERVLDIGCGCGATMIAAAEKVGPGGSVVGLDVSAAMLTAAHELAPAEAPVSFVQGDAMVHHFKAASADIVISRLGVMYFANPVRAVLNIRNALRSEGRIAFACWGELRDNPWALEPLQAAYDHVPKLPGLRPHAPDDFAFGAGEWIEKVMTDAGVRRVRLERCDMALDLAAGNGLEAAVQTALAIGPVGRAVSGQPSEAVEAATAAVRKALARYAKGQGVTVPASFWIVTAVDP